MYTIKKLSNYIVQKFGKKYYNYKNSEKKS